MLHLSADVEQQINRLGPSKIISAALDFPRHAYDYRGWADRVNVLRWPRGADDFATCVIIVDSTRLASLKAMALADYNDYLASLPAPSTQKYSFRPSVQLEAMLAPAEAGEAAETYYPATNGQTNWTPITVETSFIKWKLYPLTAIPLAIPGDGTELWAVPLVDLRYFFRATGLQKFIGTDQYESEPNEMSSISVPDTTVADPLTWMPPLRWYPTDAAAPSHYVAMAGLKVARSINAVTQRGSATDLQADGMGWRVVNRDVSTNFNAPFGFTKHNSYTGIVCDYPDDPTKNYRTNPVTYSSYHEDAIRLHAYLGNAISGGEADRTLKNYVDVTKLQFMFRCTGDSYFYQITTKRTVDNPTATTDFDIDTNGIGSDERKFVPRVYLPIECSSRYPTVGEYDALVVIAKRWSLLYSLWRKKECYLKFPYLAPVIPNGYVYLIEWSFAGSDFSTTYNACTPFETTPDTGESQRERMLVRIDGEGAFLDGLGGKYAWTEMAMDQNGQIIVKPNYRRQGFVKNVNGISFNYNYAQDYNLGVAVPIGLVVYAEVFDSYIDTETGLVFDNVRFVCPNLVQFVVPDSLTPGTTGGTIQQYNYDGSFSPSKRVIVKVLG
jgi:hypothetical protein